MFLIHNCEPDRDLPEVKFKMPHLVWFPCAGRPDWASLAVAAVLYWHGRSHFHYRNDLPPATNWQCAIFPRKSTLINSNSRDVCASPYPNTAASSAGKFEQWDVTGFVYQSENDNIGAWHRQLLTPCQLSLLLCHLKDTSHAHQIHIEVLKLLTMMLSISWLILRHKCLTRYRWLLLSSMSAALWLMAAAAKVN